MLNRIQIFRIASMPEIKRSNFSLGPTMYHDEAFRSNEEQQINGNSVPPTMAPEWSPINKWNFNATNDQWPFQEPQFQVPPLYFRPIFQTEFSRNIPIYPNKTWPKTMEFFHPEDLPLTWAPPVAARSGSCIGSKVSERSDREGGLEPWR